MTRDNNRYGPHYPEHHGLKSLPTRPDRVADVLTGIAVIALVFSFAVLVWLL